ncbi:MAG: hypothetical protein U0640_06945 [Phycisphaerales bacterium]
MKSDSKRDIEKLGKLDEDELADLDPELRELLTRDPPADAILVRDLLQRVKNGEPTAMMQWKNYDDGVFYGKIEQRPGELETLWTGVGAEWSRVSDRQCGLPTDVPALMKLACEVLVRRDGKHWYDVVRIPARLIVAQASKCPTRPGSSAQIVKSPKWFRVATDGGITDGMLRQAHSDHRLFRAKKRTYAVDDVCRVWPDYGPLIQEHLSKEREKASKSVEKRRT